MLVSCRFGRISIVVVDFSLGSISTRVPWNGVSAFDGGRKIRSLTCDTCWPRGPFDSRCHATYHARETRYLINLEVILPYLDQRRNKTLFLPVSSLTSLALILLVRCFYFVSFISFISFYVVITRITYSNVCIKRLQLKCPTQFFQFMSDVVS